MSSLVKNGRNTGAQAAVKILITLAWFGTLVSFSSCYKYDKSDAVSILKAYCKEENVSEKNVIWAIEKLSQEAQPSSGELLIQVLKQPNLRISIRALWGLGVLRDQDSVNAIAEFALNQPPEILKHAIEAARKIGGRNSAAWLFTLSSGYDDEKVCAAAKLALNDVESRLNASL